MTTTLRTIVDQLIAPMPGALGRYTQGLARGLIRTAPPGCAVEGIVASSPEPDYERVVADLPGLSGLYKTSLARRELAVAWQLGATTSPSGGGMIHAPSLFAPLRKHDPAEGMQVVTTVHDLAAVRHPESLPKQAAAWERAMLKRARRFADAVVVPTHALAEELAEWDSFGDRIRVVPAAPRGGLVVGPDAAARAGRLGLPRDYFVAGLRLDERGGTFELLAALRLGNPDPAALVLVAESEPDEARLLAAAEHCGIEPAVLAGDRVRIVVDPSPADLAVILAGALAFVAPATESWDPTPLIEAFAVGTPVVHSDLPVHLETSAGAALVVAAGDGGSGYIERLRDALARVASDGTLADRLGVAGGDRAHAFSWSGTAAQIWQLHADL